MTEGLHTARLEVVRGHLSPARAESILRFWADAVGFRGPAANQRLGEVLCVLIDADGQVAGVNSAVPACVPMTSGRRFWVYRSLLAAAHGDVAPAMVRAAYQVLNDAFDPLAGGPIGLCVTLADLGEIRRRPDAEWRDPRLLYVGYASDGQQVRVAYFDGARISDRLVAPDPGFDASLDGSYAIDVFAEQDAIDEEQVIDLWLSETRMSAHEAHCRRSEIHIVSRRGDDLAGVTTRSLKHVPQLGMDLWANRGLVAAAHRHSAVGLAQSRASVADHERRWRDGDRSGSGMLYEIEDEAIKQAWDIAAPVSQQLDFPFLHQNEAGDHVRVHYFPGAPAPGPPPW